MDTKEKQRPTPTNRPKAQQSSRGESGKAALVKRQPPRKGSVKKTAVKKAHPKQRPQTNREKQPAPEVVYTEPGLFNRNRMILRIATVAAIVLALIFGISIFFKVETVTVAGNVKYTSGEILEASDIRKGDNLLGLNDAKISNNIMAELPYVSNVRVGIKLPNTVKIEIVELEVVYSIEADDGSWWLIRADGNIIEKTNNADAELHTKLLGVQITKPVVGEKAVAAEKISEETTAVKAEEQLDVAVSLMQYLEQYGVIGQADSINVENLGRLELWYGTQYRVVLGDTTDLEHKVSTMKKAIDAGGDTRTGELDVTFTNMPDQPVLTPFE